MSAKQITLYAAKICPWAHRAEIALKESGLPYKRYEIDLRNKPNWYASKINSASKVPAVAYGGPDVDPANPSPESQKIAESGVLMELFADLSDKNLLPKDPIARAKARLFAGTATSIFSSAWYGFMSKGNDPAAIVSAVEVIQDLLPAEGYAVGEWSIADAAITSFLARAELTLKNDIGVYEEGKGKATWETLQQGSKFSRFRQYLSDVKGRDSFKETFYPDVIIEGLSKMYARPVVGVNQ